jgi:hypothetical protein
MTGAIAIVIPRTLPDAAFRAWVAADTLLVSDFHCPRRGALNCLYDELIKPALAMLGDADKSAVLQAEFQFATWPCHMYSHPDDLTGRRTVADLITDLRMTLMAASLSIAAYLTVMAHLGGSLPLHDWNNFMLVSTPYPKAPNTCL